MARVTIAYVQAFDWPQNTTGTTFDFGTGNLTRRGTVVIGRRKVQRFDDSQSRLQWQTIVKTLSDNRFWFGNSSRTFDFGTGRFTRTTNLFIGTFRFFGLSGPFEPAPGTSTYIGAGVGTGELTMVISIAVKGIGTGVGTGQANIRGGIIRLTGLLGVGVGTGLLNLPIPISGRGDGVGSGVADLPGGKVVFRSQSDGVGSGVCAMVLTPTFTGEGDGVGSGEAILQYDGTNLECLLGDGIASDPLPVDSGVTEDSYGY